MQGATDARPHKFANAPKQDRSRASFERVLDAATTLLAEKGYAQFTLSELSRRAKVSIGSIYCRVQSKDDLIRQVQVRTLEQYDLEFGALINRLRRKSMPLTELVPAAVKELGEFHRRHAAILSAFMARAPADPVIEATGRKAYQQTVLDFKMLLLERRKEIRHPDPDRAVETCHSVIYSSVARFLGLSSRDAIGEGNWAELIEDLGQMSLCFLLSDRKRPAR